MSIIYFSIVYSMHPASLILSSYEQFLIDSGLCITPVTGMWETCEPEHATMISNYNKPTALQTNVLPTNVSPPLGVKSTSPV